MSLLSEVLVISGVAMDLVGAAVLSHAHNAESMVDIREEIGVEKSALGEEDVAATQAQLLAEKRSAWASLSSPSGSRSTWWAFILKSTESVWTMAALGVGVVVVGLGSTALWVRICGHQFRREIRRARGEKSVGDLPEQ